MKKYIIILVVLALMSCEKTIYIGGTVTDNLTGDSINGIEMGLYIPKPGFSYEDKKWSELELIATAISNSDGLFSMEVDGDFSVDRILYLPLLPSDTLSVNAQYTPRSSDGLAYRQYGINGEFKLARSSHILFHLTNFTQEEIEVHCGDQSAGIPSLTYSPYLSFKELLTGQKYKFDFYEVVNVDYENPKYLGSTSLYVKTQLPDDPDNVDWEMPIQEIEIDYNNLEK